jgi:predicted CXXCH cytochrome family protein
MIVHSIKALVFMLIWLSAASVFAQSREVSIIYPKDHAVVNDKVNLVLDPTEIPYFQVFVGNTGYPIVDTSAGRHAYQGLALKPGINTITVKVFTLSSDPNREELVPVASREISVFSKAGLFKKGDIPPDFTEVLFHSREREISCSGCHPLEVDEAALTTPDSSDEAICSGCHRTLPVGNNVHDPVAVWKCSACHDPELYPVKYQFTRHDPWKLTKNILPVLTVKKNNARVPGLKDRERIVVNLDYAQGPGIKKLKVLIKIPKGARYVMGSAVLGGQPKEPRNEGDDLVWEIGNRGTNFSENLSYMIRKEKGSSAEDPDVRVTYTAGKNEIARNFMSNTPVKSQQILEATCKNCHKGVTGGKFGHEPVETGHCNLCHNPHASSSPSLLREPTWLLCTECHADKASGIHVLVGTGNEPSHPTRGPQDPSQPGKQFSCVSCHNPHSADSKTLLAHNKGSLNELCQMCHQK